MHEQILRKLIKSDKFVNYKNSHPNHLPSNLNCSLNESLYFLWNFQFSSEKNHLCRRVLQR